MWKKKELYAIGGLLNAGFAHDSDLLLVVSHQGKGLYDCMSGERIARDRNENFWPDYDEKSNSFSGIGSLVDVRINTHGLHGDDRLPKTNAQGDSLVHQGHNILLRQADGTSHVVATDDVCELRVFGFSPTGRTLLVGTSCDLTIWTDEH